MQQPIVAIDALIEAPHFGADIAVGDLVGRRALDPRDASAAKGDCKRARIRTVERARRLDVRFGRSRGGAHSQLTVFR